MAYRIVFIPVLLVLCCFTSLFAAIPKSHVTDLALVYGNVKYYYPSDKVKPSDWNKVCAYILKGYQADSIALNDPSVFHLSIEKKYKELGLTIHLYHHPIDIETDIKIIPKGKHWQYKGYPFSSDGKSINSFFNTVEASDNAYQKTLEKNSSAYLKQVHGCPNFTYSRTELLVQLHDSLWLGLPWNGEKRMSSKALQAFRIIKDKEDINCRLMYVIDAWNLFYHFSHSDQDKEVWLARLQKATDKALNTTMHLYDITAELTADINDGQANYFFMPSIQGRFYKIDNDYYYSEKTNGSQLKKVWKLLAYNGVPPEMRYQSDLLKVSANNPDTKSYLALRRMGQAYSSSTITLQLQDMITQETVTVQRIAEHTPMEPGEERTHGKATMIDTAKGIYYMDAKNMKSDELVSKMKMHDCKATILDLCGYITISPKFMETLVTKKCFNGNNTIPTNSFPERNMVSHTTIPDSIKPSKFINKYLVVLCDETSISYTENLLMAIKSGSNATIIGRPSAGTIGNITVAPVYVSTNEYDLIPFTPMFVMDANGKQYRGITPDIIVRQNLHDLVNGEDEIFNAAKNYLVQILSLQQTITAE